MKQTLLRQCLRVSAVALVLAPMLRAQGRSHLTLEDLLSVQPIGDAALSPNGKTFALARDGQIELMSASGSWPVELTSTSGGKSGVAWSPDGTHLAYASQGSIWVVAASGGAPRRLTNGPAGAGDPRQATDRAPLWSPNGRWILFQSGRRGSNGLAVTSPDGNAMIYLTPQDVEAGEGRWSPDGAQVAYIERTREHFSGSIKVLAVDERSGEPQTSARTLYTSPTDRGGGWAIRSLAWSPDGKQLVTVLQNSGWDHLYSLPVAGGKPAQLTDGAFEDNDPVFSPDGKSLAFLSSRGGLLESTSLYVMAAGGGEAHAVAHFDVPGQTTQPQWSPDGKSIYFHHQSPQETNDLFVAPETGGGSPLRLTSATPKNFSNSQVPERVTWKSKDGREISGLLYTPPGDHKGQRLPAVLWIHGGPEGQDVYRLDGWAQYLAQAGYLVLEPNYRGSTGYGEAFRNLNVEDSGGLEVDDVALGAQYLVHRGLADPARLAIGGGSHGGTMVAYMVVRYPELFAAAIELFGVVDRTLFVERTNPDSAIRWQMKMGGSPAEKPDNYRRADVLLAVDKVKTPLLVMHGENDPQVPPADSALFVKALKAHGKTVFYFTYPGELHGFSQPAHRLDAWEKQLAFLQHYINPRYGTTSTSTEEVVFPGNAANEPGEGAKAETRAQR